MDPLADFLSGDCIFRKGDIVDNNAHMELAFDIIVEIEHNGTMSNCSLATGPQRKSLFEHTCAALDEFTKLGPCAQLHDPDYLNVIEVAESPPPKEEDADVAGKRFQANSNAFVRVGCTVLDPRTAEPRRIIPAGFPKNQV